MTRRIVAVFSLSLICALSGPSLAAKKKKAAPAEAAGPTDQPSPVLERALKLYDAKEYQGASIELFKVVEGETPDVDANRQKAEFFMGKTLYNMKFLSAALTFFDRIVETGPPHPYYGETLKWLASLAQELADPTAAIDRIGKYDRSELEQPALETVRDHLYFLLGRSFYRKREFEQAIALFRAVPRDSKYYVKAKLFEGATHVQEYKGQEAAEAFKEVLRVTSEKKDPDLKPYEELANLSLARTFYSTGQYQQAAKYYDRVSPEAYDWANGLFEASWANFMLRTAGYPKALGNIHTLQAPYFENFVKPESVAEALTVKATIYFYNCLYDRALEAIGDFNRRVPPLAQELAKVVQGTEDNTEFFELAHKIQRGRSGLPKNVERAARAVLSDLSLERRFKYVDQLDKELDMFDNSEAAWKSTAIANAVYTDLTLQKSLSMNEAGDLARQRVTRLVSELSQLIKRVIKIEYEILQGEKGNLQQEIVEEQQIKTNVKAKEVGNVRVDDEHLLWPFRGEYWRDELGYYRVRLQNKCARSAPEGAPSGPTE